MAKPKAPAPKPAKAKEPSESKEFMDAAREMHPHMKGEYTK